MHIILKLFIHNQNLISYFTLYRSGRVRMEAVLSMLLLKGCFEVSKLICVLYAVCHDRIPILTSLGISLFLYNGYVKAMLQTNNISTYKNVLVVGCRHKIVNDRGVVSLPQHLIGYDAVNGTLYYKMVPLLY